MKQNPQQLLDAAAGTRIPADVDLTPRILQAVRRIDNSPNNNWRTFMQTLRAKPALMILFVLLALALLSGAAYAIGRSLGYIPGVGIVEEGAPIRVLAEPVSLTRDGITLTVDQAYLTPERTVLSYTVSGIPQEARPKSEAGFFCRSSWSPSIRLSDGTLLESNSGEGSGWPDGYRSTFSYPPIPPTEQTVTFLLPCLEDVAPAAAPQDWELTLHFVPAPPDLTVAPVLQIATPPPTPTAPPAVTLLESESFMGISLHLEAVQNTGRGYLIETSVRWQDGLYADYAVGGAAGLTLTDANGQEIELSYSNNEKYMWPAGPRRTLSGYSFSELSFTPPLTLTLPLASANLPLENRPSFTFDPGPNPQPGQEWQINQTIEVLGLPVEILSARYVTYADLPDQEWWVQFTPPEAYGFEISLRPSPEFRAINLSIDSGFSPDGGSAGGHPLERDENGIIKVYTLMGGSIVAPLVISVPYVNIAHDWQISFDPRALAGETPALPDSTAIDISLQIEQVIPTEDGYYLIGRTIWDDPRFSLLAIGEWGTRLLAPDGTEIPIEPVYLDEIGIRNSEQDQWGYRVFGKVLPPNLKLTMSNASVWLAQPYTFSFQPGLGMQEGQEWALNQPLEMLGYTVNVQKARYMIQGDGHGFEFNMQTDSPITSLGLGIQSGVKNNNMSGGGGSLRDKSGNLSAIATTGGQFTGEPIVLFIYSITLGGEWQTTWNPPAAPAGATPFYVPQACLGLDSVKQALANPPAIPSGLEGRLLLMRGALAPDPTLFIVNLDGSAEIPLAFGHGTLSPDGSRVAYSDENNQLTLMEVASKKKTILGAGYLAPRWSPDGTKIAFQRETPKGFNIFIMDSDGANPRALTDTTEFFSLSGWSGDGQSLLIQTGTRIEFLNVNDGRRSLLLEIQSKSYASSSAALSPDGKWLAYLDKVVGRMTPGLYLKALPDGEPRLLVQLEHWSVFNPVFSPDGRWLAFSVLNGDTGMDSRFMLINTANCQVIPLNELQGEIRQWVTP
jgi:hypothetical protein